jgi:hypothetical protein
VTLPRRIDPGTVYHVIVRCVAQEFFISGDCERYGYRSLLGDELAKTDWRCLSFAIMSNHIHLAMLAGSYPFGELFQAVHTPFAIWINQRLDCRIGAVLTKGPKTIAVGPEGVAPLIAYIHCNPVRASVVTEPDQSDWTSQQAYAGIARPPAWLDMETGARLGGFADPIKLAEWVRQSSLTREQLDSFAKRRRGRPRKQKAPSPHELDVHAGLLAA